MPTTTPTKTAVTLVASGTSNAATSNTRAAHDLRTAEGGLITMKITNGATGPTVQCEGRVLVAHNDSATPSTGAAGADWKTLFTFGGGTVANAVTEIAVPLDPSIMHVEVEFIGNTGQAVTVEAYLSKLTGFLTT